MKLNDIISQETIDELAKVSGVKPPQVEKLVKEAVPILMESMHENAQSADGAKSLARALEQHAGSPADSKLTGVDVEDGKKILAHVLGDNQAKVGKQLSKATGVKNSKTTLLLALLAPLLLNALGNTAQHTNTNHENGLGDLLGTLLGVGGNGGNGMGSLLTSLLGMGGGSSSLGNNSGSLLGSLFGLGGNANSSSHSSNNSGDLLGSLLSSALSEETGGAHSQAPIAQTLTNELGGNAQGGGLAGMLIDLLSGN